MMPLSIPEYTTVQPIEQTSHFNSHRN